MRHRTGLHNRGRRRGASTYCRERKRSSADSYGSWSAGRQERPDVIAGTVHTWKLVSRW